ncbi:glycosyltransferase family 39 protein [Candidatus Microgenomates bacterium]|nr:glycosyltransferase family 39 protein [Candidatus Microgenomates bacterium]
MSSIAKLFGDKRFWLFFFIFALAAFLRFYRLPEYLQFLGDEGRDVLVVKRMIVDHQWTLLGPTASVGGFYTGPVYYYFMIPFLWAFQLDPVGPAVMAALFGLATVALIYYFTKIFVNDRAAVVAAFLAAISPKMVDISRFSWNPNPVPLFTLLTFLCLYLATRKKRHLFTFLAGLSLGILYQLHYTDLTLFPIVGVTTLLIFPLRQAIFSWLFLVSGFILGNSPFLLFEARHGFPNTKTVWEFLTRGTTVAPRSYNLFWLFYDRSRILFEVMFGTSAKTLLVFYFGSLLALLLWVRNGVKAKILLAWFLLGALGIGFYRGQILDHYFGYLYPLPFILIGLAFNTLAKNRGGLIVGLTGLAVLTYFSIQPLFLWQPPNNLLAQTKGVDQIVIELAAGQPYNFALIAPGNSDHAYRYFLEIGNQPPVVIYNPDLDPTRASVTNQLLVVCEQKECAPLGNPLWEIAGFGRAEIAQVRQGPAGIRVLKLVHYKG